MKASLSTVMLFLCLNLGNVLNANNTNPSEATVTSSEETRYALDKIFFNDFENNYLFVDFEPVTDELTFVNLWRGEELMMVDNVTDLPSNTIYEFNTGLLRSGDYTIELVTLEGVKIHKKLSIE